MADIRITRAHGMSHAKAKAAAQQVADQMAEEYGMTAEWSGDVLHFARDGVSGDLLLLEQQATLQITLDFLFKAFAPVIEQKVTAKMDNVFRDDR